ncbi:tetratricopeptide repeat protein [Shewanella woodyi]|uniref:Tetratricopeptide repeat protein n=1 Tax=Shewanella woodyi (strain ATCC 51908 / MS32) TaxID=392500 RepID=B1KEI7_SHEWM|nr:tetratricopeptide repeat protein [Shewanella woodyi]ACA86565.1 hypothetical protein Swoo_2284 [Shewanella woodyi ATCC 51908]
MVSLIKHYGYLVLPILFSVPLFGIAETMELKDVKALIEEGRSLEVVNTLKERLNETSEPKKRAELQGAIGWTLVQAKEYEEANKYLESSLVGATDGGYTHIKLRANNNLGILHYLQNDFEVSRSYFNQEIASNSKTAKIYLRLLDIKEREYLGKEALLSGVGKRQSKQFQEAINEYEVSLEHQPNNPKTLEFKGYAEFRLGNLEEAYHTLEQAKHADPKRKFTHLNLLKVSCALKSLQKVLQVINGSELEQEVFIDWAERDLELQRVCDGNEAFTDFIQAK